MKPEKLKVLLAAFKAGKYWCDIQGNIFALTQSGPFANCKHKKSVRLTSSGYLLVTLNGDGGKRYDYGVHQVVWVYFHGGYAAPLQINHINGNKQDNRLVNLELVSASENIKHAHRTGAINQRGALNPSAILTEEKVRQLRELYPKIRSLKKAAKMFGVSSGTVWLVVKRKIWSHVI